MARRSQEAARRMRNLTNAPPIGCGTCGQRFWTYEQLNAHRAPGWCVHTPIVEKPAEIRTYHSDTLGLVTIPE